MAFLIERPIPDRPYFKVGEVARILGVVPSTVRFWQKEFPDHIKPELSKSGQNVFSRNDVIVMAVILNLVRIQGSSLKEARPALGRIVRENGGKVENIMLVQQFELELARDGKTGQEDNSPESPDRNEAAGAGTPEEQDPQDVVSSSGAEPSAFSDPEQELRGEIKALTDEIQALEDENTCLRNQISRRVRENEELGKKMAASSDREKFLEENIKSAISRILETLKD